MQLDHVRSNGLGRAAAELSGPAATVTRMTVVGQPELGPEQLTLAHMPTRLFGCTPSRLAAFDCPRRYRFTYLDRPAPARGAPWAHNTVGATAHLALHRWWLLPRSQRTPDEGASLVERNWQANGFRDDAQSAQACVTTAAWVRQYLADHVDPADEPVGVERTVAMRTERLAVSGRVDRVDDRDGELVVVDYKTGRRELTADDARGSQALALYVLGVRRTLRRGCNRVELHHLPTGKVSAFEHTDESLQRHLDRAESAAEDIVAATDTLASGASADDVFPPMTSSACGWCDFRQHCPEGRAASPDLHPWAGLAEPPPS
ncbi:MAG: nuclease superfamily protein [Jatrophihabitans sp.]|nr:nuclease superfamily protein [Jatrophihabitans sp.]